MIDTQAIRSKILDLAMRGKLTEQLPEDGTAEELYRQIQAEKQALIKAGKIKKEKPLAEIAADEVPFEIPKSWKWARIGAVLNLQSGKNITASDIKNVPDDNHMIPCYGGNGQRGFVGQANTEGFHAIIGRQGALCGNINFAEGPFYATEHAVVVYGYAATNMKWAGITLRSLNLNQYATSVAQPGLAVNKIDNVPMPLPPLAEQHRIVERIEQAFSALDTIDALQAQYADNLTVLKSKLIDAAIQGKLTVQLPEDGTADELYRQIQAEKQVLIKAGKIKKEKPFSASPEFLDYPFTIPTNWTFVRFGDLMINRDSERIPVSVEERRKRKKVFDYYGASGVIDKIDDYLFDKELLLIGEDGANLLARSSPIAFIASGQYWVNNHAHVLDVCGGLSLKYICLFINSISLDKYVTGTAQPKINQENMNAIWIALPPLAEQKRIVERVTKLLAVCDELKAVNPHLKGESSHE